MPTPRDVENPGDTKSRGFLPGGLTGRIPDVPPPDWDRRAERAGAHLLPPMGKKQPPAADKQKKETKGKKEKCPQKGDQREEGRRKRVGKGNARGDRKA